MMAKNKKKLTVLSFPDAMPARMQRRLALSAAANGHGKTAKKLKLIKWFAPYANKDVFLAALATNAGDGLSTLVHRVTGVRGQAALLRLTVETRLTRLGLDPDPRRSRFQIRVVSLGQEWSVTVRKARVRPPIDWTIPKAWRAQHRVFSKLAQ
jgi:hypothetical protein